MPIIHAHFHSPLMSTSEMYSHQCLVIRVYRLPHQNAFQSTGSFASRNFGAMGSEASNKPIVSRMMCLAMRLRLNLPYGIRRDGSPSSGGDWTIGIHMVMCEPHRPAQNEHQQDALTDGKMCAAMLEDDADADALLFLQAKRVVLLFGCRPICFVRFTWARNFFPKCAYECAYVRASARTCADDLPPPSPSPTDDGYRCSDTNILFACVRLHEHCPIMKDPAGYLLAFAVGKPGAQIANPFSTMHIQ